MWHTIRVSVSCGRILPKLNASVGSNGGLFPQASQLRRNIFSTQKLWKAIGPIVSSPMGDIAIPENIPLHQYMFEKFETHGNRVALVCCFYIKYVTCTK